MQFVILTSLMHVHAISIHYESFPISHFPIPRAPANMLALPVYIAYFMSFICFNSCTLKIIRIA